MTQEPEKPAHPADALAIDAAPTEEWRAPDADWLLQNWVSTINALGKAFPGMTFPITLICQGAVVSGKAIAATDYFRLQGELVERAFEQVSPEAGVGLKEQYAELSSMIYTDENAKSAVTAFIHLKDAKIYDTQGGIPKVGLLWRGRISEVGGYAIGEFI